MEKITCKFCLNISFKLYLRTSNYTKTNLPLKYHRSFSIITSKPILNDSKTKTLVSKNSIYLSKRDFIFGMNYKSSIFYRIYEKFTEIFWDAFITSPWAKGIIEKRNQSQHMIKSGRYHEAIPLLEEIITQYESKVFLQDLIYCYCKVNKYQEALELCSKILSKNPNDLITRVSLANIYSALRFYDLSIEIIDQILDESSTRSLGMKPEEETDILKKLRSLKNNILISQGKPQEASKNIHLPDWASTLNDWKEFAEKAEHTNQLFDKK